MSRAILAGCMVLPSACLHCRSRQHLVWIELAVRSALNNWTRAESAGLSSTTCAYRGRVRARSIPTFDGFAECYGGILAETTTDKDHEITCPFSALIRSSVHSRRSPQG